MKIERVVCQVLRVPVVEAKTAGTQDTVLIRVIADNGLEGVGEADASPEVIKAIVDAPYSHTIACGLRTLLLGENPLETERLWETMYRRTMYYGRRGATICAMAGVDMALWDLKGKALGQPIHRLLGGRKHATLPAYASILFGKDAAETREIAARWRGAGYRAIKFGWEPMGQSEALDIALVRGAREGFGDDGTVLIDAGCVWDARTALQRAQRFAEYGIGWLEEPLAPDDIDGYAWLRDRSPVPIAAGEEECGRASFRPLIEKRALDIYQIDLARNGFTDAHYLRQRVEEIGARLCNHCYKTPISVAACLHWLSTHGGAFLFEDCVDDSPLRHELTQERLQAIEGTIAVPDAPGLGVTLDDGFVRRFLIAESG
jgi:L-alanine-DL-glutamate epimerase-like enolase superfamily enzyme